MLRLKIYKHISVVANIDDDLPKVVTYFADHKIDLILDVENTDIEKGNAVLDLMLPNDGKYDVVMYLYNRGTFQDTSFGLCFKLTPTLEGIYLATSQVDDAVDYSWKSICHELMHALFFKYTSNGGIVPMDKMLVDNVWTPYYKNEDLYATDGNFATAFTILKNLNIILGMRTLRAGDKGEDVKELQKALNLTQDGVFGVNTLKAVKTFQQAYGLNPDGVFGLLSFAKLLEKPNNSKIELWISAITIMEGAKPERNNPGNLRYVGQKFSVDDNGFCKFDTVQHGHDALKTLLVNACTGKSKIYKPEMTLYEFYGKYAPSSDGNNPMHYAEFVAKKVGVLPTEQIKNLI